MTVPTLSLAMDKPGWLASMEAVLEVLDEGVVITNEHQQILFANSRFVEITGIPRLQLIGSDPSEFYSAQEWDFVAQPMDVPGKDPQGFTRGVLRCKSLYELPAINHAGKF